MTQELIKIYIELLTTINNILIPLTVFVCILIVAKILTKFYVATNKAYNDNEVKNKEIQLLKEKYKNENNK